MNEPCLTSSHRGLTFRWDGVSDQIEVSIDGDPVDYLPAPVDLSAHPRFPGDLLGLFERVTRMLSEQNHEQLVNEPAPEHTAKVISFPRPKV
jgi:hypothetical protein